MAKATEYDWLIDRAFQYLARVIGMPRADAIYKLTEKLQRERLRIIARRFVDGKLVVHVDAAGKPIPVKPVPAWFYGTQFVLRDVGGAAVVEPLVAWVPGTYEFAVPSHEVLLLWPAEELVDKNSNRGWCKIEVARMIETGEIDRIGRISDLARRLAERLKVAAKNKR